MISVGIIAMVREFYRGKRNEEITQLLKKEVFMNSDQQGGVDVNAWLAAAANGNTAAVKSLLANGIDVDTKTPSLTALMWAASGGHTDTVRVLLDADADVNAIADDGSTPLMHAVLSGNVDTVKVLLDAGADVHTKNNIGVTALSIVPGERSSSFALGGFLFNRASKSRQGNIAQLLKEAGAQE